MIFLPGLCRFYGRNDFFLNFFQDGFFRKPLCQQPQILTAPHGRRLQVLHVHVFLAAQLGARRVAKSGADQHQGGVPVRECPHHTGAAADLTVQPLDHVVGTDAGPMLAGKIAVGQRFLCTIFSDIVCCLLSEWCVVTSFYQSLHAMSSFMRFSICAPYCTLSSLMLQEL